ncbi:MAG: hypothetical protein J6K20_11815 [Thermoguttaceae bacterium]|nr:hypothetical protein [Thermoguttaceae bacterium]
MQKTQYYLIYRHENEAIRTTNEAKAKRALRQGFRVVEIETTVVSESDDDNVIIVSTRRLKK